MSQSSAPLLAAKPWIPTPFRRRSTPAGGVVEVPAGSFLTGTLELRSNVVLTLDAGATLLASTNIDDYHSSGLIRATGATHIGLAGPGTIDGRGYAFWTKSGALTPGELKNIDFARLHYWKHNARRSGDLVELRNCSNVAISNIVFQNSESWTCHLLACDHVTVDHLKIRNPPNDPNTDGIDVDGSQQVRISHCDIYTGDDAVCLKNRSEYVTYPHECKDVTVSDCTLVSPTNGFKIGTETYGDFENIVFENSTVEAGDPANPLCKDAASMISPQFYGDALGPEAGIAIVAAAANLTLAHLSLDKMATTDPVMMFNNVSNAHVNSSRGLVQRE